MKLSGAEFGNKQTVTRPKSVPFQVIKNSLRLIGHGSVIQPYRFQDSRGLQGTKPLLQSCVVLAGSIQLVRNEIGFLLLWLDIPRMRNCHAAMLSGTGQVNTLPLPCSILHSLQDVLWRALVLQRCLCTVATTLEQGTALCIAALRAVGAWEHLSDHPAYGRYRARAPLCCAGRL